MFIVSLWTLPIYLTREFCLLIAVVTWAILYQTKGLWVRRGIFNGMVMQSKVLSFWEKRKTDAIWKFHALLGHWNKYKWQKWMARQDRVTSSTEYIGIAISLRLQQTNIKCFWKEGVALVEVCQLFVVSRRSVLKKLVRAACLHHLFHWNKLEEQLTKELLDNNKMLSISFLFVPL